MREASNVRRAARGQTSIRRVLLRILLVLIGGLALSAVLRGVLITSVRVTDGSMAPTLLEGDLLFVVRPAPFAELAGASADDRLPHGSLVLVKDPSKPATSSAATFVDHIARLTTLQLAGARVDGTQVLVRRVLGKEGDVIRKHPDPTAPRSDHGGGHVRIVGHDYGAGIGTDVFLGITIGEDEYFLGADASGAEVDSRQWGPVDGARIEGRVVLRWWPLRRFGVVE